MSFNSSLRSKLITKENARLLLGGLRMKGKKIIFTNGCFDVLHPGHVDYLTKARDLGDFMVLGLNTDSSVKRLGKAPNRPVNNEQARALVLAGLTCIDAVVLFDENTPYELIDYLQPDVVVKGNDYKPEEVVGYDIMKARGGQVVTIPLLEGFSTTKLIDKLRQ